MVDSKYVHPNAHPELLLKTEEEVRSTLSKEEAAAYLDPMPHPDIEGYLLPNSGHDATPLRVRVLRGTIHEPDGTPRVAGDIMIMPQYVADQWLEEKRIERV